jgi:hypothetical protein
MATTSDSGVEKPPVVQRPFAYEAGDAPQLHGDSIDEFLLWAGGVPAGATEVIRERIAAARDDSAMLDRLLEALWRLPVRDEGRHYLLLSTIGELGDGRAAPELARFIWEPDEEIASVEHDVVADGCGFGVSTAEVLKARAAEMLAHLRTSEAIEATLRVAADHPAPAVRAAAIDAHLYNHDDSPEEMERLRGRVRSEDVALVGLPRFTRDVNPRAFDRAIAEFYERNPERLAPTERNASRPAEPRSEG